MTRPLIAAVFAMGLAGCQPDGAVSSSSLGVTPPIRVAAVGADMGSRAAYQVFAEGDLPGSVTHLEMGDFNHLFPEKLRASYDVLLFTFVTPERLDADYETRLSPFLELGGGVIFEDPGNTADLAPAALKTSKFPYQGTFALATVPGLTSSVSSAFPHNHFAFTAWDPRLAPLETVNGIATGLYGGFRGGGRLVVTGTDQHAHGDKYSPYSWARNQYHFLRNELCWTAACVNQPPVADAGGDRAIECTGTNTEVPLDASRSYDTDRDFLSYLWTGPFGSIPTEEPRAATTLPVGEHHVTLAVSDTHGAATTDSAVIRIMDTVAPAIAVRVLETELWSPDHKMVLAAILGATDACDASLSLEISVTSDEPANATGDGNTAPDWLAEPSGDGTINLWLRAERSGTGDGRTYTVQVAARDAAANSAIITRTFQVGHP